MRKVLYAPKGKAYTNGIDIHGYVIVLEVGLDEKSFYLIPEEEYKKIVEEREKQYDNYNL